jgi:hypothetical protein
MASRDNADESVEIKAALHLDPDNSVTEVSKLIDVLTGEDTEHAAELKAEIEEVPPDRDEDHLVRVLAASYLSEYAKCHPPSVAAHAATIVTLLDTSTDSVRQYVADAALYAADNPEPFIESLPDLISLLDIDNPDVQQAAVGILMEIADFSSEAAVPAVDGLVPLLNADDSDVRRAAVLTVMYIAEELPDAAVPAVDALISLVDDPAIGHEATKTLAWIGYGQPAAITAAAQPVVQRFRDPLSPPRDWNDEERAAADWVFRRAAIEVIAGIALVAPEMLDGVSEPLTRAVQGDEPVIREQAVDTICVLILERPEAFAALEPELEQRLDDEEPRVRRGVAQSYIWIALDVPTAVNHPAAVAERLRHLTDEFDLSAAPDDPTVDDIAHALQILDSTTTEENH